jgi:hypothetical protein
MISNTSSKVESCDRVRLPRTRVSTQRKKKMTVARRMISIRE